MNKKPQNTKKPVTNTAKPKPSGPRKSFYMQKWTQQDLIQLQNKFTQEEITNFDQAFVYFDHKVEQKIFLKDLGSAIRSQNFLISDIDLAKIIPKIDKTLDRKVDYYNYLKAIDIAKTDFQIDNEDLDDELSNALPFIQGIIKTDFTTAEEFDARELKKLLTTLGDICTQEEINQILSELDIKQNLISVDDFEELLQQV